MITAPKKASPKKSKMASTTTIHPALLVTSKETSFQALLIAPLPVAPITREMKPTSTLSKVAACRTVPLTSVAITSSSSAQPTIFATTMS